jgi:hypothetical protein
VKFGSVVSELLHKVYFAQWRRAFCMLLARDRCKDIGNVIIVTGYFENVGIDTSFVKLRSVVLLHKVVVCTLAACTLHVARKGYMSGQWECDIRDGRLPKYRDRDLFY